jgi:hypothetical protein
MRNGLCRPAAPHRDEGCGLALALAHRAAGSTFMAVLSARIAFRIKASNSRAPASTASKMALAKLQSRANTMPTVFFFLAPSETTYWIVSDPRRRSSLRGLSTLRRARRPRFRECLEAWRNSAFKRRVPFHCPPAKEGSPRNIPQPEEVIVHHAQVHIFGAPQLKSGQFTAPGRFIGE